MRLLFSKILDCKYIAFFSTRKINIGFFLFFLYFTRKCTF
jgi:hypothetical protein